MWINEHEYVVSEDIREGIETKLMKISEDLNIPVKVNEVSFQWHECEVGIRYNDDLTRFEAKITMGNFFDNKRLITPIIALAHELGHALDILENLKGSFPDFHKSLGTLNIEFRAWAYAISILEKCGFTQWDVFISYARYCLYSYYKYFELGLQDENDNTFGFNGTSITFEDAVNKLVEMVGVPVEITKLEELSH